MESHGRHKYFRLASGEVAHALEALTIISQPERVRSLRQSDQTRALRFARTCYDHLAGELGVALTRRLVELNWLEPDGKEFLVKEEGVVGFHDLQIDVNRLRGKRRPLALQCLDWSERHYHMAGAMGVAVAARFFEMGWIVRMPSTRAVRLTDDGRNELFHRFSIEFKSINTLEGCGKHSCSS